jgi:hypothetical protein
MEAPFGRPVSGQTHGCSSACRLYPLIENGLRILAAQSSSSTAASVSAHLKPSEYDQAVAHSFHWLSCVSFYSSLHLSNRHTQRKRVQEYSTHTTWNACGP